MNQRRHPLKSSKKKEKYNIKKNKPKENFSAFFFWRKRSQVSVKTRKSIQGKNEISEKMNNMTYIGLKKTCIILLIKIENMKNCIYIKRKRI